MECLVSTWHPRTVIVMQTIGMTGMRCMSTLPLLRIIVARSSTKGEKKKKYFNLQTKQNKKNKAFKRNETFQRNKLVDETKLSNETKRIKETNQRNKLVNETKLSNELHQPTHADECRLLQAVESLGQPIGHHIPGSAVPHIHLTAVLDQLPYPVVFHTNVT